MRKKLKIYLPFTLNELKSQMAYKGAFYLFIFISLFGSFISYFLWMAIYGSAEGSVLGGLTKDEMVIYIFMVYVTKSLVTINLSAWISDDIVKGTVAMNLIKPIDYRASLISRAIGKQIYYFLAPGIFIWVGLEFYKHFAMGMAFVRIENVIIYLFSCILSFLIYVLLDFCFGMVSFYTTYIFGLRIAQNAILSFLTGVLIPLSFFPSIIQRIFDFLPFSSMVYTPVMIYLGKYSGNTLLFVLSRQIAWVILLYFLGSFIWGKVTKKLVVLGG